ncbi:MAG: transposase [Thermodesulfovibrionia bacterium]|nr:transposase [Thermodesulfovibrionia bacterium]
MARQLRIEFEGAFYHITSRGNQREQIYWDNRDKERFQEILKRTKERYGYLLHAYVLMDNHFHLLIETPHANIKQIMQNINTSYTVYANNRHKRVGHLFQGRYKAIIVEKENYLLELGRYIHLNPVRAGIVKRASEYRWSSYREYVKENSNNTITDTGDTLYLFSKIRAEAMRKYQEFVFVRNTKESPLQEAVGSVLGGEAFTEKVFGYLQGSPDKTEIPDIKKIEAKYNVEDIVSAVANYYGLKKEEIMKRNRTSARQRKIAIYLGKILSGQKNGDIGKVFNITTQAVTNVLRDIEQIKEKNEKIAREIIAIKEAVNG